MKLIKLNTILCALLMVLFGCGTVKNIYSGTLCSSSNQALASEDLDLYLEEVYGKSALNWVEKKNEISLGLLTKDKRYEPLRQKLLKNLDAKDQLLQISVRKGIVYNFWRDEANPRGILRATKLSEYKTKKPSWKTIIDIDLLAKQENENWVYKGQTIFNNRALLLLSRGGKDATVIREYDLDREEFVADGFNLPEGKHRVEWVDAETLLLGLALNGQVTDSGYPKHIRLWRRGEPFEKAKIIFRGEQKDVSVSSYVSRDGVDQPARHIFIYQAVDFFNSKKFYYSNGKLTELGLPTDSDIYADKDLLYIQLKSDWAKEANFTPSAGDLIRAPIASILSGEDNYELVYKNSRKAVLSNFTTISGRLFLQLNKDVTSEWVEAIKSRNDEWQYKRINLPKNSNIYLVTESEEDNLFIMDVANFLTPVERHMYSLGNNRLVKLESAPKRFSAKNLEIKQYFARSSDGTEVPYFVVGPKNLKLNGKNPTLLNAYGGFEVSLLPNYSYAIGLGWLENGGVYVLANIRGGGEYGPEWHQAALKEKRQNAYDDFYAVANDLINKKITSPKKLGIFGGSNGGLLMGVAITQKPELFEAAAIQVPLLDMIRYTKLLAGASWIGEYGDPEDPKMREVILKYSPYQNLYADKKYPEVFFMTSTADDRVHPGHARRMAAKMDRLGKPFLYYENTEGGHGGSANNEQRAKWWALQYTYFAQKLM
jgi:prolyl oligopeptidase